MEDKVEGMLTIFTPTYNRKDLLPRLYTSLQNQTVKEFVWLVVDDGSYDGTGKMVREWIEQEKSFTIEYVYKENGGLHTGYNTAIKLLHTELAVCIDSDDWIPADMVEKVLKLWSKNGSKKFAGIIGLDYDESGNCLGDKLPEEESISLVDLTIGKYRLRNADRKLIIRSDLYKEVAPMPEFDGEKNFNPQYMHIKIGLQYPFLVMNECLCIVEYQPNGMTNSIFRQYYNSPNSFATIRLQDLSLPGTNIMFKFKKSIHYCSSCFLAGQHHFVKQSPVPVITALTVLPGWIFSRIIVYKNK